MGNRASRLVLMDDERKRDLGGRCPAAVRDIILHELDRMKESKA